MIENEQDEGGWMDRNFEVDRDRKVIARKR